MGKDKCIDGMDLIEKKPKNQRGPTGPTGPAGEGHLACGRLIVLPNGNLAIAAADNIVSLAVGSPAPGVRSWLVTTGPIPVDQFFETISLFGNVLVGGTPPPPCGAPPPSEYNSLFFIPRLHSPLCLLPTADPDLFTATLEIFITDAAGNPINPDPRVSIPFTLNRCGPGFIEATP